MKNLNIPVGISDFAEIRKNDYYYVDKTGLIAEFLKDTGNKGDIDHAAAAFWQDPWYEYAGEFF